ncbi:MAG TPA: thioredoxin [Bdellovibrionales bacterium]|nr:thioredoxin [Bdellovibrionales bacterium]
MEDTLSVCPQCEAINRVNAVQAKSKAPTCGKCGTELRLHGLASDVSASGLKKLIAKSDRPVIVDFWASWCGPCKMYSPTFERASLNIHDAVFVKVDTEKYPELSNELGIRGIPTTIVYRDGREFRRESGVIPEEMIPQLLR